MRDIVYTVPVSELQFPTNNPTEHAHISKYIEDKQKTFPYANGIGLNDKNGIITHTPSIVGFDASQREWFRVPKNNPKIKRHVSNMFNSNTGEPMVIQTRKFPGDEFNGMAGIGVNLKLFSSWLEKVSIGTFGILAICDQNVSLLARKPAKPEALGKKVNDPIVRAFISSSESNKTFRETSPLDNEARIYSARKIEGLPFIVLVGEADREWQAAWIQHAWITIGALIILWFLALYTLRIYWLRLNNLAELKKALAEVKKLSGLLPICSYCKKICDDKGYWTQIESYIHEHSEADFSHGICQECAKKHYPDLDIFED